MADGIIKVAFKRKEWPLNFFEIRNVFKKKRGVKNKYQMLRPLWNQ